MASLQALLASSLTALEQLQRDGRRVFQTKELSAANRKRLLDAGYLQTVLAGWVVSASPSARSGDTTPWYTAFWEFIVDYCSERFDDKWACSPEESLKLHAEHPTVPQQLIIHTMAPSNKSVTLLHGTSLMAITSKALPPDADVVVKDGVRLYSLPLALTRVSEAFFAANPTDARLALTSVRDASEVLRHLLVDGKSVVAGRLAGAFRKVGRADVADEIVKTMKSLGYEIRETDPFVGTPSLTTLTSQTSPIIGRLRLMWERHRGATEEVFPPPLELPNDVDGFLAEVEAVYVTDAYHSLSIEGYRVTPELIERVKSGTWDPVHIEEDRKNQDALAARGYWQAFRQVKLAVGSILGGVPAAAVVKDSYRDWYRQLFQPCAAAGIISAAALVGFRRHPVYLRGSRHMPPRYEVVPDAMSALFDLLAEEPSAAVRAVLGHWMFGYIHPYLDGNGRVARFLMNAMLASGGYPWTIIRTETRNQYLAALEAASVDEDIRPFAAFIGKNVHAEMTAHPRD